MKIYANNPIIIDNPSTGLQTPTIAGSTSLTVYNTTGLVSPGIALLGRYTDQQSEITYITGSLSNTGVNLTNGTIFPHPQDTPLTVMPYDKVEFSRSDDGGVTYSVIGLIPIQTDRNTTYFPDNGGSQGSLWRFRFFNTLTATFSVYSNVLSQSGYLSYQLENLQERVVNLFPDLNMQFLTYDNITTWFNECLEVLAMELYAADRMALHAYITGTLTSYSDPSLNQLSFQLPDNFVRLKRLALSEDNINYYRATPVDFQSSYFDGSEFTAYNQFAQTSPGYFRQDNTIICLPPTGMTYYKLYYYRLPNFLIQAADSLEIIFRPYTHMFVDYCLYRAKLQDKKQNDAELYLEVFNGDKERFIETISIWQLDEPDIIDSDDFSDILGDVRQPGRL